MMRTETRGEAKRNSRWGIRPGGLGGRGGACNQNMSFRLRELAHVVGAGRCQSLLLEIEEDEEVEVLDAATT
jgi:hypothetical protein